MVAISIYSFVSLAMLSAFSLDLRETICAASMERLNTSGNTAYYPVFLTSRAGTPITVWLASTFLVTTAPAPTIAP